MSGLAVFGNFIVLEGLVTPGDAARTGTDILASEGMFRFGVASWVLIALLDVLAAWALLAVFSPVNRGLSMLAAWSRLAYAVVLMVAVSQLVGIPRLLHGEEYLAALGAEQLQARALLAVAQFNDIWDVGLILFGVHLLLIGYLAYRSGYVPRLLGVLLVVAGLGYVIDGMLVVISQTPLLAISSFTWLGEFLLALWLIIWGRRISLSTPTPTQGAAA